ncbi:MAG: phosphoribosyltransferase domain-containing protein [Deltaproteobacteria bacterium]|nr:phosphoribosyltransferase domain-containing protein [Deltaproteobacteria bacterium]
MLKILNGGMLVGVTCDSEGKHFYDLNPGDGDETLTLKAGLMKASDCNCECFFGYEFTDTPSGVKTPFIRQIKKLYGSSTFFDEEISDFVTFPMTNDLADFTDSLEGVSCIVHPVSSRTGINQDILASIERHVPALAGARKIGLVKYPCSDVKFNFDDLRRNFLSGPRTRRSLHSTERKAVKLIESINSKAGDFFISEYVRPVMLRLYMRHFLHPLDTDPDEMIEFADGREVLVVDDVNTTGSTINEVLRVMSDKKRRPARIVVYTLFGKGTCRFDIRNRETT